MEMKGEGDGPLVSNRVNEKSDLQNLNHRFAAYIQAVRSAQERQNQQRTLFNESRREENFSDAIRQQYEQQIAELEARLEEVSRERQELDMNRVRYETTVSDYENRIYSLNETVFEKQNELQRLYGALAAKDVELQEARSDATQPRLALDGARMEVEDLRKRLEEAERRLQLEGSGKTDMQQQLVNVQNKMQQEVLFYQQELTEMRNKLENSHQLILQLEEKVRKAGQSDSSLMDMMGKVREASEAELRRFMEETEAKYSLNIQEVKMRMDADVHNLTSLAEDNATLQGQIDTQAADIRTLQAKLSIVENQKQSGDNALENERSAFQSNVRNLERKLQETQDLLLVKIRELGIAQEANVPLRAEINALKTLVEEEEKRLNLSNMSPGSPFISNLASRHQLSTSATFAETLGGDTQKTHDYSTFTPTPPNSNGQFQNRSSNIYQREASSGSSFPLPDGKMSRRPASVPIMTRGFRRGGQTPVSNMSLESPTFLPTHASVMKRSSSELESKFLTPSTESISSQMYDLKDGEENINHGRSPMGIDELPPRPENPTPTHLPRRPLSATNSRYVPAVGGHGKDYFDVMFNDLRKDTLYSRVTEDDVGPSTAHVSSVHQDLINSTGSQPAGNPRTWFGGASASSTGNLKLLQVADDGSCVSVSNTSATQEENIGGFMLQQNVGGHPVAVFRFPPRARLQPATTTTIWSAKAVNGIHNPPFHYVWSQLDKWGTGPECTTILCKANGQAVAWITSAPQTMKIQRGRKYEPDVKSQSEETQKLLEDIRVKNQQNEQEQSDSEIEDGWKPDPVTLPSMYTSKPTLYKDSGYDPKPIPTIRRPRSSPTSSRTSVTSGLLPSRTGSAPLHLHQPRSPAMQVSQNYGAETPYIPPWSLYCQEEEDENFESGVRSAPPNQYSFIEQDKIRQLLQSAPSGITSSMKRKSPGQSARIHLPGTFWPPAEQHKQGMEWIRSQHNVNFSPPMPKAFPCITPIYRASNKTC